MLSLKNKRLKNNRGFLAEDLSPETLFVRAAYF
jgi:hypothetical protein